MLAHSFQTRILTADSPVVIKEAALDSPTFRATAVHFGDQIDLIERWLTTYVTAVSKLANEMNSLQTLVDAYVQSSHPPLQLSEAVLDHDYTVLALKRFGEGAREFWNSTLRGMKRAETTVCEPVRAFLNNDLRMLKEARKNLDSAQRTFDGAIARYAGQAKTKEPSSLREDAFQLHEARKEYLRASMNFCVLAPQVRATLDKVLVKVVTEQWRDMKLARDSSVKEFARWSADVDRVRGWSKEMENGERVFKRELHLARQQIESSAELAARPSRELDTYAASTIPYLGTQAPSSANLTSPAKPDPANEKAEKQGWLFQRTITGKPARTYWVRRWFFVKHGIFGWLTQGARSGAVEESEKIGVLLCGIRPAFQEERRFCFEVKTKDTTVLLQAETQADLTEWISSFEVAKRKALEDTSKDTGAPGSIDAAFSISPPVAPEFAAKTSEGHPNHPSDDAAILDRTESLGIPGSDLANHGSFDVTRRSTTFEQSEGGRRDHATRIMEKLDLTRKSQVGPQLSGSNPSSAAGGIASLISASLASASHNIVQVGQITAPAPGLPDTRLVMGQTLPASSLAPSTLANPPAPTNLSKAAVAVSGERGLGLGKSGNMPGGLMANLWGSVNWGYVNRLMREEEPESRDRSMTDPPSPLRPSPGLEPFDKPSDGTSADPSPGSVTPANTAHRKTMSLGSQTTIPRPTIVTEDFPNYYPLALRMQDAQFRILFPTVPRAEKLVLVFRAVWNPTDQQEFPGRVYITAKDIYFYSNHLGLVLITSVSLSSIDEVTAAPGKDCDFLFLHFKTGTRDDGATRLTVKTFLEPLKLLLRRLNFLVRNATTEEHNLEEIVKKLIKMEANEADNSPSADSWEEVPSHTPMDPGYGKDLKTSLRIDGNLFGPAGVNRSASKFKLPAQPVVFSPQGMNQVAVEKEYEISAKGLFHILFGDKSAVFQMLYRERWAQRVVQGPWTKIDQGHQRRDIEYEIVQPGKKEAAIINDYQIIEVLNDHLCYVVADRKTPWYLPGHDRFILLSKIVVTHVSKSRCKLEIHTKVDWIQNPRFAKKLIERQGLQDMELEAQDLVDVVNDQVARLGHNRNTGKVTNIFGQIGVATQAAQFTAQDIPPPNRPRKFKLRPQTTGSFVAQLIGNIIISIFSTLMSWILAICAGLGKVVSAHTLLVILLIVSGGANFLHTSRDSWQWWHERNAAKFMTRLGVGPSTVMSRSVYIRDLEESFAGANETGIGLHLPADAAANKCHQTFTSLLTDPSAIPPTPMSPSIHAPRRLHRTRQNLGSHRHDLLVALRVVNRIEKEVIEAEYENWLLDETHKCERIGTMLGDDGRKGKKEVEAWVKGYCGDCERALGGVRDGRGLI
ncbi:transcription factor SipA3 [Bimuria novae-zelandiae CBS 107.79]|uniref:Transcription factor SipA3 n=1 Tax=Bimuria novae-zelandiae CBS 107.79 TaxID=1447943 RepID=A0A6A5UQ78_9PLEO|nr:transcription factor SipA3 [Bimuria novae-zelandiae CBS 107.79]